MTYQFSIIGCQHGHIGSFISEMLAAGHHCVGIYDPGDQTMVQKVADRFHIPVMDSMEPLLSPSVDIVGSSAVNNRKIDILEQCEQAGKHAIFDKPLVTDRGGLERLKDILLRGKIQVGMQLPKRFNPMYHALKNEIERGTLGEIVNISVRSPHKLLPAIRLPWHFSKKENGGLLIDLFIHDFDLVRWLTGKECVSIHSVLSKNTMPEYPDFYDTAAAQVILQGGAIAQLYADWQLPHDSTGRGYNSLWIVGTKSCAKVEFVRGADGQGAQQLLIDRNGNWEPIQPIEVNKTAHSDFLDRVAGLSSQFTHADLYAVCCAVIEADEQALVLHNETSI